MDVACVVCVEMWDSYGVSTSLTKECGDMKYWEAQLFRQGAGCPGCRGQKPKEGGFAPKGISDFENGDEDELERIHAWEDAEEGRAPAWERPKDKVLWTCESCGVQVRHNVDWHIDSEFGLEWFLPHGSRASQSFNSYRFDRDGELSKEPTGYILEQDEAVPICPLCMLWCYSCDAPLGMFLEPGDGTELGVPYYSQEFNRNYCIDCCSSMCSECGEVGDECECSRCSVCGEREELCECDGSNYDPDDLDPEIW